MTLSNTFWCQDKTKESHFGVPEEAFGKVDLELVFFQFGQDLVEYLQVVLVSGRVDDDIVDVHNDVVNAVQYLFHKPLE